MKKLYVTVFVLLSAAILFTGCDTTSTASLKWRFKTGGPINSSPAVADGVAYVGSHDHYIYAVDIKSGELKWRFETRSKVFSSPAVADSVVYVGSNDGYLYAIDKDTGELIWRYETNDDVGSTPSVVDGVVYVGDNGGFLYAIDAITGDLKWSTPSMPSIALFSPSPTVFKDFVYFGSRIHLYVFEKDTGKLGLKQDCMGEHLPLIKINDCSKPTVVNGVIYFGNHSSLSAYFAENCKGKWSFDTKGFVYSSPSVANNMVFFVSGDGFLYAVDANDGKLVWKSYIGLNKSNFAFSSPAVADGVVYVGSKNHLVFAVNAENGELVWRYKTGGPVLSSPAASDGVVYIGSNDGYIYALEMKKDYNQ